MPAHIGHCRVDFDAQISCDTNRSDKQAGWQLHCNAYLWKKMELSTQFALRADFKERSKITSSPLVMLHSWFPILVNTHSRVSSPSKTTTLFRASSGQKKETKTEHYPNDGKAYLHFLLSLSGWVELAKLCPTSRVSISTNIPILYSLPSQPLGLWWSRLHDWCINKTDRNWISFSSSQKYRRKRKLKSITHSYSWCAKPVLQDKQISSPAVLADEYSVQSQAVCDSLSSSCNDINCCWEIAPLNHPAETQTAQSHCRAAHFILLILWKEALATACVNLASQSTLAINNLSAYATLSPHIATVSANHERMRHTSK